MRKIILTLVTIAIIVVSVLCIKNGINGPLKIYSYSEIQQMNSKSTEKLNALTNLKANEYKIEESALKKSVAEYEEISEKYELIAETKTETEKQEALSGQEYDLEVLQILLGKHADNNKVHLGLELSKNKEATKENYVLCDIKIQAVGSYSGIINFIEDVSSDEKLKFIPENLKMYSEYREVNTIAEATAETQNENRISKKQNKLVLVGEFYKSNVPITKDTILKIENSQNLQKDNN